MKLLFGLHFFCLICSVCTLQCLQCVSNLGQCSTTNSTQCGTGSMCTAWRINLANLGLGNGTSVVRSCISQTLCTQLNATALGTAYSGNFGASSFFHFFSCCNFTNCNSIYIPEPDTTPNRLRCAACDSYLDTTCSNTVSCVGIQDRCMNYTVVNATIKGCVSKSICEAYAVTNATCSSGNTYNGSEAMVALLAIILLR